MIPRIIHYCWFGRNPLPKLAQKCIASWKKFFPDYEIKEWNEDNFDVNIIPYTQQAYEAKKYAFVSDYARFWILYHYGGLYFDTDVEIIRPMDDIVKKGPFMGVEVPANGEEFPKVAPGLGLGAISGNDLYQSLLEKYSSLFFINKDGSYNLKTVVAYTTETLMEYGLQPNNCIQEIGGLWIYPSDYFNPMDSLTGRIQITNNTRSVHRYMDSWSDTSRLYKYLSKLSHRIFGLRLSRIRSRFNR